mmetsp:Transcript_9640/g.23780  ORF Transcript_9640/g.23780 Transcript_9640/m.23780 type:complete len:203 (-) Transcript_9640:354-962(-)
MKGCVATHHPLSNDEISEVFINDCFLPVDSKRGDGQLCEADITEIHISYEKIRMKTCSDIERDGTLDARTANPALLRLDLDVVRNYCVRLTRTSGLTERTGLMGDSARDLLTQMDAVVKTANGESRRSTKVEPSALRCLSRKAVVAEQILQVEQPFTMAAGPETSWSAGNGRLTRNDMLSKCCLQVQEFRSIYDQITFTRYP